MFYIITATSGHKYPSGLTSGKPPFSFRGLFGTSGFLKVHIIAGKVTPSSAAKHPKKERKAPP